MPEVIRTIAFRPLVRQQNATVDIEHAPVTLAVLMEFGGRAPGLNRQMGDEVARAAQQLLDELGPEDKVTFWKYSDQVQKLADANQSRDAVKTELITMGTPAVSETNLYDAILATVAEMSWKVCLTRITGICRSTLSLGLNH